MRRKTLIPIAIVAAVLILAGVGSFLVYTNYYFYSTDDAQVTGNIVDIVPSVSGTLTSLNVQVGDFVSAKQTIGTIKADPPSFVTTALTAPISGVIVQVPGVVGARVSPQAALVQETDLSGVKVSAYVDESVFKNIHAGQPVDIKVDAYGGGGFTGRVSQVVNAAAGQFSLLPTGDNSSGNFTKVSQRFQVQILLDGNVDPGTLLPGMSAEVTIHLH